LGKTKVTIGDLVAGMVDQSLGTDEAKVGRVQCPRCHMVYSSFKETGRLGCSECYTTFRTQLRPLLRRIHGSTKHVGKAPLRDAARVAARREVHRLHEEMQRAVDREEFEKAAELRDRIRRMDEEPEVTQDGGTA
jgi:protein arginine kinase activator